MSTARRGGPGPDPLEVAVQHLAGADAPRYGCHNQQQHQDQALPWNRASGAIDWEYQPPLSTAAASGMHRVSRRYRGIARGTRTYANLSSYLCHEEYTMSSSSGNRIYRPLGDTDPALVPWGFLGEASAVTAVALELRQVPVLLSGPPGLLQDLTGRLRALKVSDMFTYSSSKDQFQGLAQLLAQCTGLQVLYASGPLEKSQQRCLEAALVVSVSTNSSSSSATGPDGSHTQRNMQLSSCSSYQGAGGAALVEGSININSSSSSTELGACRQEPLPLLELSVFGLPLAPFAAWLQRRGQAGQLRSLALIAWDRSDFDQSMQCLTGLTGLQKLRLEPSGTSSSMECGLPGLSRRPPLPPSLAALSGSLTQLSIKGGVTVQPDAEKTLGSLTQLRHLQLRNCKVSGEVSTDWVTALRQLTHLDLSGTPLGPLPQQLGRSLPHLEVLELAGSDVGSLPKGLTRLTRLHAPGDSDERFNLDVAALCQATALRDLDLSGRDIVHPTFLTALTQLEVLRLKEAGGRALPGYNGEEMEEEEDEEEEEEEGNPFLELLMGMFQPRQHRACYQGEEEEEEGVEEKGEEEDAGSDSGSGCPSDEYEHSDGDSAEGSEESGADPPLPPLLPRLVHLRHLDLTEGRWWVYDLAALGGLRQLTYLNLSGALAPQGDEMEAGLLPALGVLPVLQQLNLQFNHIDSHQWPAVGAWLGQQPQLTRLSLQHTKRHQWEVDPQQQALGLAQLPTQLVELDLTYCNLQQLPRRLSQLTRLRVLLVGEGNPDLPPRLPAWLPALRALETLQVQAVKGPEAVELLAQLPRLQRFGAFSEGNRYAGLAGGWEKRLAVRLPHVNLQLGRDYTVCFFPCHFEEWHSCYDMD